MPTASHETSATHSQCTYIVADHPSAPVLVYRAEPDYSDEARKAGLQGTVALRLTVDTNGLPANIQMVRGVGLGLDGKAVEAVKQWKFRPAYCNGQSISVETTLKWNFASDESLPLAAPHTHFNLHCLGAFLSLSVVKSS